MKCPCNPSKLYSECCQIAHQNIHAVKNPETLMRSRYSAFVLANIEYLQRSHHTSTQPSQKESKEILNWTISVEWIRLEVLNYYENTVEFKAYFMENGKLDIIHENSLFSKENEHWVYIKGDFL